MQKPAKVKTLMAERGLACFGMKIFIDFFYVFKYCQNVKGRHEEEKKSFHF